MGDFKHFASRMRKLAAEVPEKKNKAVIYAAYLTLADLIWITPVDTSKALSNWQASLHAPFVDLLEPYSPGYKGSTQGVSATAAMNAGENVLQAKKPGDTVYLSNVTPYIVGLDEGSSSQFAGGFVARARLVFRKAIEHYNQGIRWLNG